MDKHFFATKKDAIKYFGHTWKYIEKYYLVKRCFSLGNCGSIVYYIEKPK